MANIIQLKRKTTAGAPALASLAIGEVCLVLPDQTLYWKKDATTLVGPIGVTSASAWGSITGTLSNQTDLQNALNAKAALASPTFSGTPTVPTAAGGTNTTQIASTAFVQAAIATLVASSPAALDTLQELAAALGNDANFATTIANSLALKLDASSTLDGGSITT